MEFEGRLSRQGGMGCERIQSGQACRAGREVRTHFAGANARGKNSTTPSSSTSSVSGWTILRKTALRSGGSSLSRFLDLGETVILRQTCKASSPEMRRMAMADLPLPLAGAKMVRRVQLPGARDAKKRVWFCGSGRLALAMQQQHSLQLVRVRSICQAVRAEGEELVLPSSASARAVPRRVSRVARNSSIEPRRSLDRSGERPRASILGPCSRSTPHQHRQRSLDVDGNSPR